MHRTMETAPKLLIFAGTVLIVFGLLWHFAGDWLRPGQFPGDIRVEGERWRFYFPIVTSLLLSALLTLLLWLFQFLNR